MLRLTETSRSDRTLTNCAHLRHNEYEVGMDRRIVYLDIPGSLAEKIIRTALPMQPWSKMSVTVQLNQDCRHDGPNELARYALARGVAAILAAVVMAGRKLQRAV